PRFLFSALGPILVLLAGALVALSEMQRTLPRSRLTAGDVAIVGTAVTVVLAVSVLVPERIASYRIGGTALAFHPARDAASAGLEHAVVLVPDGFGSRLIVRPWAAGVPMAQSDRLC